MRGAGAWSQVLICAGCARLSRPLHELDLQQGYCPVRPFHRRRVACPLVLAPYPHGEMHLAGAEQRAERSRVSSLQRHAAGWQRCELRSQPAGTSLVLSPGCRCTSSSAAFRRSDHAPSMSSRLRAARRISWCVRSSLSRVDASRFSSSVILRIARTAWKYSTGYARVRWIACALICVPHRNTMHGVPAGSEELGRRRTASAVFLAGRAPRAGRGSANSTVCPKSSCPVSAVEREPLEFHARAQARQECPPRGANELPATSRSFCMRRNVGIPRFPRSRSEHGGLLCRGAASTDARAAAQYMPLIVASVPRLLPRCRPVEPVYRATACSARRPRRWRQRQHARLGLLESSVCVSFFSAGVTYTHSARPLSPSPLNRNTSGRRFSRSRIASFGTGVRSKICGEASWPIPSRHTNRTTAHSTCHPYFVFRGNTVDVLG